jgi:hypothetical protein
MMYRVTKKYTRGSETPADEFADVASAKIYISDKLAEDALLKLDIVYRIYEGMDMVAEFNQDSAPAVVASESESESQSGQGQAQSSSFQPTPFNMAPRPTGMPQNWVKDLDNNSED